MGCILEKSSIYQRVMKERYVLTAGAVAIKSKIDCRAGKTQTSTSESGWDFSLASTLQSKIKNQKSKIDCRAGKAQTSTSESGGDFSLASTLQSKIPNQKSKID
jgi:uncharacterized protein Veg